MIPALVFTACVVAAGALAVRYVRWLRASGRHHDDLMAVADTVRETPADAEDAIFDALVEASRIDSDLIWLELESYQ